MNTRDVDLVNPSSQNRITLRMVTLTTKRFAIQIPHSADGPPSALQMWINQLLS